VYPTLTWLSFAQVAGPTTPSTLRLAAACTALTAVLVREPKPPSIDKSVLKLLTLQEYGYF
jgi:hypothetical protein